MGALMIQGCGSDVGKSVLVAGLCRVFRRRGLRVAPFKPQNMSNNAAVTCDGGEIGRAQALQAMACGLEPHTDMNPVLLKPQSEIGAQLIVQGRMRGNFTARAFQPEKPKLLGAVLESFGRLKAAHDLVLVEGAGSPAEINLRANDIANMGFARAASVPVALVGDIDRGHVIAALVGAHAVLDEADRAMIRGFIVNKFRGDPALFDEGRRQIAARTGWADLGMVPFAPVVGRLPAEDAMGLSALARKRGDGRLKIVIPHLPTLANFDDLDPLRQEPELDVRLLSPGEALPADTDLVLLAGTKATLADLAALRRNGWDIDILAHVRRGGRVLGLCGGYQMLGRFLRDPGGIEGPPGEAEGLGLLDIETVFTGDKTLTRTYGRLAGSGAPLDGFEMHVGRTSGPDMARPFLILDGERPEGAVSADGRIMGTYLHGLFASGAARSALLNGLGAVSDGVDHAARVNVALDELANILERHLAIDEIAALTEVEI